MIRATKRAMPTCNLQIYDQHSACKHTSHNWKRVRNEVSVSYCWFSYDVTKIQTKKLSILPRFYFRDALEQLKTNFHTNFRFNRVLAFTIEYARISKLSRDAAFT